MAKVKRVMNWAPNFLHGTARLAWLGLGAMKIWVSRHIDVLDPLFDFCANPKQGKAYILIPEGAVELGKADILSSKNAVEQGKANILCSKSTVKQVKADILSSESALRFVGEKCLRTENALELLG